MFRDGTFENVNAVNSLKPKSDEITSMCWATQDQTELLTAQMDRNLKLYDSLNGTYTPLFQLDGGSGAVRGIHATNSSSIISAVESGELRVWKYSGEMISELNAGNNLLVMVGNSATEGQYATGGNENPLKVWDIHVGQKTFTAKNVRPDNLQLRVPVWDTDIRFIPDSQNIVTTTGRYQIRIYDPRAQRRPVKEMEWPEEPLTAISLCHSPMHIVAGNTRGEMGLFDLRNKMHLVCKLKGIAGSVRGIDAHPSTPYVASCSIDRFVRLHDISTKKVVKKVLAGGDVDTTDIDDASTSEDDEALWNDMRETIESKTKGKHKNDRNKRKYEEGDHDEEQGRCSTKKSKIVEGGKRKYAEEDESATMKKVKKRKFMRMKRCADGSDGSELLLKRFHSVTELNV
uniref:WD repeat-containing protein 74 n=1 Tax=Parascaris equorum TaxID=6256 RepID=A0A914RZV2_PAREQ